MKRESREIEMDTEKENSYGIGAVYLGKAVKGSRPGEGRTL